MEQSDAVRNHIHPLTRIATLAIVIVGGFGAVLGGAMKTTTHTYPSVPADHVTVLYQEPDKQYELIAFVSYVPALAGSYRGEIDGLRKQAARLGADAVIITSVTPPIYGIGGTGKAIKWRQKGKGASSKTP